MPLDDVHANVNELIAHHQRKTSPAPPPEAAVTEPPPPAAADEPAEATENVVVRPRTLKISEKTLWTVALALMAISALLYAQSRRVPAPAPVRMPDGLQVEGVIEHQGEHGWSVDGVVHNGPSNVRRTVLGFSYTDDHGTIISQVVIDLRDIKAGERREFSVLIPGYSPGLTRNMVPLKVLDYND